MYATVVYVAVAVSGIVAITIACSIIALLCFVILINKCERKPESGKSYYMQGLHNNLLLWGMLHNKILIATPPEAFTMVTNEVYGNVNQYKMSDNAWGI